MQIMTMASHWVGLTFPGMMLDPGSLAGRISSPSPQRGPEASQRMSLAIFMSDTARLLNAAIAATIDIKGEFGVQFLGYHFVGCGGNCCCKVVGQPAIGLIHEGCRLLYESISVIQLFGHPVVADGEMDEAALVPISFSGAGVPFMTLLYAFGDKASIRTLLKDHIGPFPWLVIDQPPFMTRAGVIYGHQDITRIDSECLASQGCKFQDAGECDDVLGDGIVVPVERRMWRRFFEEDGLGFDQIAFAYAAFLHVRISIGTRVKIICAYHCMLFFMFSTAAVSART
jgi:hypothetical protein